MGNSHRRSKEVHKHVLWRACSCAILLFCGFFKFLCGARAFSSEAVLWSIHLQRGAGRTFVPLLFVGCVWVCLSRRLCACACDLFRAGEQLQGIPLNLLFCWHGGEAFARPRSWHRWGSVMRASAVGDDKK